MRKSATRAIALVLGLVLALTLSAGCNWGNVNIGIIIPLGLTSEAGLLSFLRNGGGQVIGGDGTSNPPLPTPPDVPGTTGGTTGTTGATTTS